VPRTLGDVIDCWLPGGVAGDALDDGDERAPREPTSSLVLPVVCVPVGDRDVLRTALLWNLVVEVARLGGRAVLVAPERAEPSPAWPVPGPGPGGSELVLVAASGLGDLRRAALDVAVERAAEAVEGGLVVVQVPPRWLVEPTDAGSLLRWALLLATAEPSDLLEAHGLAKRILAADEGAEVGVTLHGVRSRAEAESAFARLARAGLRHLGRAPTSYGLLVDDLAVYRAIVSHRPVGLFQPQSPAARSLRDVASLLLDDARERALA
jgi:hypothetical protein